MSKANLLRDSLTQLRRTNKKIKTTPKTTQHDQQINLRNQKEGRARLLKRYHHNLTPAHTKSMGDDPLLCLKNNKMMVAPAGAVVSFSKQNGPLVSNAVRF